ncbi:MAG: filamentous hemagglutinin N-terminal domain-containing protein, partial [Proteobacteria bacterium]|nr:filamentous hemagglutinin N-terminal domain-containing protein [Pseudomonadota bacterium]
MSFARRMARARLRRQDRPERLVVRRRGRPDLVVPGERSMRRPLIVGLLAGVSASALMVGAALAGPKNGTVVGGSATITQTSPNQVDIKQTTDKAAINWQSFSIGAGERVNFQQPTAASVALNRVTGVDPSVILGQMSANGHIVLINPNGILFGVGSRVDVAGLIATTTNIRTDDFLAGNYKFSEPSKNPNATVVNQGTINVAEGGLVALVAPGVENSGVINARLGKVALTAANSFTVDFFGDKLINIAVDDKVAQRMVGPDGQPVAAAVTNSGRILADGGTVQLTTNVAKGVLDNAINMSGIIEAKTVAQRDGKIILGGGSSGVVAVSGTLDASGRAPGEKGGKVVILGEKIQLAGTAKIDASGSAGGGKVLIGGGAQGKGPLPHAQEVYVDAGASIKADAIDQGNGGKIVVWSDQYTRFDGQASAKGGANGGDGGFIETSGHVLSVGATAGANASAPNGKAGTWLLDPVDFTISGATSNESGGPTYTPTANPATINAATINAFLSGGTSVTVLTTGAGGTGNITVSNAIAAGAGSATLTLSAAGTIAINNTITGSNLTLSMSSTGGPIQFNSAVNVANLSATSSGTITQTAGITVSGTSTFNAGGNAITLANAGNALTGAVAFTTTGGSNVSFNNNIATVLGASSLTGGGNLSVTSNGAVSQSAALTVSGTTTVNAGANTITLTAPANSLTGAVSLNNSGANNVALTNSGALQFGASNVGSGTLAVVATGAITQSGAIVQAAGAGATTINAGANAITLTNTANKFTGTVGLTGGATSLTQLAGQTLTLGTSNVSSLIATADLISIPVASSVTSTGTVTFTPTTAGRTIQVGGAGGAGLSVTSTVLAGLAAGYSGLIIGTTGASGSGDLTLTGAVAPAGAANLSLLAGTGFSVDTSAFALTVSGTLTANAGTSVALTNAGNTLTGPVAMTAGTTASLVNTGATSLGASTIGTNLTVTSGGAITQTAAVSVGGTINLNAGANAITLTQATNAFTGTLTLTASNVNLSNNTATQLAATNLAGNLILTSTGAITQSAAWTVGGTTTLTAGAAGITLTTATNSFASDISLTTTGGGAVALTNNAATVLTTSSVGGTLTVQSTGAISETGTGMAVTGASSFTTTAGNIGLTVAGNALAGAITLAPGGGADATVANTGATQLATATIGGNLSVTATGAITETGPLTVTGTSTFSAAGNTITLTDVNNMFGGAVGVTGSTVSVTEKAGTTLTLGTSTVTTALTATADQIAVSGAGVINANLASVTFRPTTGGTSVQLGGTAGATGLWVSDTVLAGLTSNYAGLTVGSATTGAVTLLNSAVVLPSNASLTLLSGSTIDTSGNTITLAGTGGLTETAAGAVTMGVTTLTGIGAIAVSGNGISQTGTVQQQAGVGA